MKNLVKFLDGPLAGKSLVLGRAPGFLRGTRDRLGKVDALDQHSDFLSHNETAFAYRMAGRDSVDICLRPGGRIGAKVVYKFVEPQPPSDALASNLAWAEWVRVELAKLENACN